MKIKNESNKGFTIIELIVTLALIVILAVVAIPSFVTVIDKARKEADHASLVILNESTLTYAAFWGLGTGDIFDGINNDTARMQKLVDEEFLSKVLVPRQKSVTINWSVCKQFWVLTYPSP